MDLSMILMKRCTLSSRGGAIDEVEIRKEKKDEGCRHYILHISRILLPYLSKTPTPFYYYCPPQSHPFILSLPSFHIKYYRGFIPSDNSWYHIFRLFCIYLVYNRTYLLSFSSSWLHCSNNPFISHKEYILVPTTIFLCTLGPLPAVIYQLYFTNDGRIQTRGWKRCCLQEETKDSLWVICFLMIWIVCIHYNVQVIIADRERVNVMELYLVLIAERRVFLAGI